MGGVREKGDPISCFICLIFSVYRTAPRVTLKLVGCFVVHQSRPPLIVHSSTDLKSPNYHYLTATYLF